MALILGCFFVPLFPSAFFQLGITVSLVSIPHESMLDRNGLEPSCSSFGRAGVILSADSIVADSD